MFVSGSLTGGAPQARRFRIGATVAAGQLCMKDLHANGNGQIIPAVANTYTSSVGVCDESATWAVSSPGDYARCYWTPDQIIRGKVSGGTAADTAFTTTGTNGSSIVTQTVASTTVITGAATTVGTLDYLKGMCVVLSGTAKGDIREVGIQVDDTTITNIMPFSASLAVGDTVLRTYNFGIGGIELTTDFKQFNNLLATTEVIDVMTMGYSICLDVIIDDHRTCGETKINIKNPTAPKVEFEVFLFDHFTLYHA